MRHRLLVHTLAGHIQLPPGPPADAGPPLPSRRCQALLGLADAVEAAGNDAEAAADRAKVHHMEIHYLHLRGPLQQFRDSAVALNADLAAQFARVVEQQKQLSDRRLAHKSMVAKIDGE